MTEQELQPLLHRESNSVDWKAKGDPENIVETLVAFANDYEGVGRGFVLCGVEEERQPEGGSVPHVTGISSGEAQRLKNRIFELSKSVAAPPISPCFQSVPLGDGKQVLVVWIAASSEVHTFKREVVIRRGDRLTPDTVKQHSELAQRKANENWLDQPCPGATLDDIDFFALEEISKSRKLSGGTTEFLNPNVRMFGSAPPLTRRVTGPGSDLVVPSRFAMLLFGKEPQRFLPGAFVLFSRFSGVTRADDIFLSKDFFGPIPFLVRKVMDVLDAEASVVTDKTQDFLSGTQNRIRYSLDALQEILVNALAHRDYQNHLPTQVFVFQDRVEFESPGGWVNGGSIEEAKQGWTRWRNPSLAKFLEDLGLAQQRGSGIPRAIELTRSVAGIEPVFLVDSWFKVTVPAYRPVSKEFEEEAVSPEAGALLISIGPRAIDPGLVRGSHEGFRNMPAERIREYHDSRFLEADVWPGMIRQLKEWLVTCVEDPHFRELHLFYRGPVTIPPLIGAIVAGRKLLVIYYLDEASGLYRSAYRLDRRLLQ